MRMLVVAALALSLSGCAKVGGTFVEFGHWVQTLDRTHDEQVVTRERRRVY